MLKRFNNTLLAPLRGWDGQRRCFATGRPKALRYATIIEEVMKKCIAGIFLSVVSLNALAAWDGVVTGKVKQVDVAVQNGDNAGFRVTLENSPALCGNTYTWAYVNKSDGNYQTTVSVLLAAKMSDKEVTIYSNKKSDWKDFCQLGYVVLR